MPTPRTDAQHSQFAMGGFTLDFVRQLERELTEMTKQRDMLAGILELIERVADQKKVWVIRQIASQSIATLKGGER